MTESVERMVYWSPRVISILFLVFLSVFALDVFEEGRSFWGTAVALVMHLLPTLVLGVGLAVAWRWEWVGTVLYGIGGVLYLGWVMTMERPLPLATRMAWAALIAGPALAIAGMFLASWRLRKS